MVRARRGSLPLSSEKLAATLPFAVPAAVLLLRVRLRRRLRAMVSGMVRARRGSLPLSSEKLAATLSFAVPTAALLLRVWARVEMCKEKEKPPYPTDLTQISLLLLSLLFGRWLLFFAMFQAAHFTRSRSHCCVDSFLAVGFYSLQIASVVSRRTRVGCYSAFSSLLFSPIALVSLRYRSA